MNKIYKLFVVGGLLGALCPLLQAEELSFGWGGLSTPESDPGTYTWQIDYRQYFHKYMAWSASWINEGHVENHHRDGFASQFWGVLPLSGDRLSMAFGVGADRWYDTQPAEGGGSADVHGWAPIYSLSLTYYTQSPWLYRVTYNRIVPSNNLTTNGILMVVGYKLWKTPEEKGPVRDEGTTETPLRTTGNEFTAFVGKTVVNTFNSESDVATGLEFRKGIAKYCDWTFSWINEGDPEIIRRNGFATQFWLVDAFLNNKLAIGIGAGLYFYVDRKQVSEQDQDANGDVAGILGPTISYRFSDRWLARLNWNRVVSDYNRDSDVFLLGLGYRWGQ